MRDLKVTFTIYSTVYERIWGYDTPLGVIHDYLREICSTYHIANIKFDNEELNKKQIKPRTMYSQNEEEKHITGFFGGQKGTLLDIGANDGKSYSNSLKLIELGWDAVLVEPSPTCIDKIKSLHGENKLVTIIQAAVGSETIEANFHESGKLPVRDLDENNTSLLSTLVAKEKERWKPLGVEWKEYPVKVFTYNDLHVEFNLTGIVNGYDFISIDAEGVDIEILKQIDLSRTKLICIEYNSNVAAKKEILDYTSLFGMTKIIYENGENLLICKS